MGPLRAPSEGVAGAVGECVGRFGAGWGSDGANTGRRATDSPILEGLPVRISLVKAGQVALPCNGARRGAEYEQLVPLAAVPHRG